LGLYKIFFLRLATHFSIYGTLSKKINVSDSSYGKRCQVLGLCTNLEHDPEVFFRKEKKEKKSPKKIF
jgi:hypothetical protein